MLCKHCGACRANRPRGLCWTCYNVPEVRDSYGPLSKFGRRNSEDFNGAAPLPEMPTKAPPGSPEKVAILEQRAKLRQELWHPLDAALPWRRRKNRTGRKRARPG